jgi:hypothetical protein
MSNLQLFNNNNNNRSVNLNEVQNGMFQMQLNRNPNFEDNQSNINRKSKLYYENNPNLQFKLDIFFNEVILPKFCINSKKTMKRLRQYHILKNYILKKLCITNFLKASNEIEKIKYFYFNLEELNEYNSLLNPLPWSHEINNIWLNDKIMERSNNIIAGV